MRKRQSSLIIFFALLIERCAAVNYTIPHHEDRKTITLDSYCPGKGIAKSDSLEVHWNAEELPKDRQLIGIEVTMLYAPIDKEEKVKERSTAAPITEPQKTAEPEDPAAMLLQEALDNSTDSGNAAADLLLEVGPRVVVKSEHGTYLNKGRIVSAILSDEPERWYLVQLGRKVALRLVRENKYIATGWGVTVVAEHPDYFALWEPRKNEDGSWSLKGEYSSFFSRDPERDKIWLRATSIGSVSEGNSQDNSTRFWFEPWPESERLKSLDGGC